MHVRKRSSLVTCEIEDRKPVEPVTDILERGLLGPGVGHVGVRDV